jgi:hypothetical protein
MPPNGKTYCDFRIMTKMDKTIKLIISQLILMLFGIKNYD